MSADRLKALKHAEATRPVSDQPQHVHDQSDGNCKPDAQAATVPQGQKLMKIPEFIIVQEELVKRIQRIKDNVKVVERVNNKAVQSVNYEASSEAQARTTLIQRSIKEASVLLEGIERENKELESKRQLAAASFALRITKTASLRKSLASAVQQFQQIQRQNQSLLEEDLKRQFLIVHPQATPMQLKAFLADEPGARQQLFADAVKAKATQECKLMEARCKEMKELAKSIQELSQLYQQLDFLVDQQQGILDSVEMRLRGAEEDTEQGKEAMTESVDILKRRQRRKIYIIIAVIILVLIVLVAILSKVAPLLLLFRTNRINIVNNPNAANPNPRNANKK